MTVSLKHSETGVFLWLPTLADWKSGVVRESGLGEDFSPRFIVLIHSTVDVMIYGFNNDDHHHHHQ